MKIVNDLLSNDIDYLHALRNAQEMPQPKENVIIKREQISAMAQQTAVEWLVMTYHQRQGYIRQEDVEQAKAMHKEQIKDAYWNGTMHITKQEALSEAEKFYNEYYNKNQ